MLVCCNCYYHQKQNVNLFIIAIPIESNIIDTKKCELLLVYNHYWKSKPWNIISVQWAISYPPITNVSRASVLNIEYTILRPGGYSFHLNRCSLYQFCPRLTLCITLFHNFIIKSKAQVNEIPTSAMPGFTLITRPLLNDKLTFRTAHMAP